MENGASHARETAEGPTDAPGLHRRGMVGERDGAEDVGGEALLTVLAVG